MFVSVLRRTHPAERLLDAALVVVDNILLNRCFEFLVAMVNTPIVNLVSVVIFWCGMQVLNLRLRRLSAILPTVPR